MPGPLLPLAVAGIGASSSIFNAFMQGRQNRLNREFAQQQYQTEKMDNLSFWNMQNEYNSPKAQMARLKAAGLNPNMVYGGGAATTPAQPLRAPSASYTGEAPRVDLGTPAAQGLETYQNMQLQKQQMDLMHEKILTEQQLRSKIGADVVKIMQDTAKSKWDVQRSKELFEGQYTYQKLLNEKTIAGINQTIASTSVLLQRNEREAAQTASNLKEALERILTMRANRVNTVMERGRITEGIKSLQWSNALKNLEYSLRAKGINPNGAFWERMLGTLANDLEKNPSKFTQSVRTFLEMLNPYNTFLK